jgi:hypothetical protein
MTGMATIPGAAIYNIQPWPKKNATGCAERDNGARSGLPSATKSHRQRGTN